MRLAQHSGNHMRQPWIFIASGWILLTTFTVVIMLASLSPVSAAPPGQSPDQGKALFQSKCTACHTIGGGKLVGPDLAGVTTRRDHNWLVRWISAPDQMLAQKDPTATQLLQENNNVPMPNLGLTQSQVADLISFLETPSSASAAPQAGAQPAPAAAGAVAAGDPNLGKAAFTGVTRFQNGGPQCMGCHNVAGLGGLGGGALGPDLTLAYTKYAGDVGLTTFLNTVPLPTMNAVWTKQPLTPAEQANLVAFLKQASTAKQSTQALVQLAGLAVVGMVVMLIFAQLYWRNRLTGVRRALVASRNSRNS